VLLYLVALALLSCMSVALICGIVFVASERWLLVGEIAPPHRRQNNYPAWGFLSYRENNSDHVRDRAQSYLLRVVALTNATEVDDGYLLNVGTNTFRVGDRYVRRLRGVNDAKSRYEQTCFFVPNQGMPSAEQIATALLMLKNDPTLFDKWAVRDRVSFKADGQTFDWIDSH
jgi:hypothetical protein